MIRPRRRGVGGLRGTLFFQTDRGAVVEHVDPRPEEAYAGFQAVRPFPFAWGDGYSPKLRAYRAGVRHTFPSGSSGPAAGPGEATGGQV